MSPTSDAYSSRLTCHTYRQHSAMEDTLQKIGDSIFSLIFSTKEVIRQSFPPTNQTSSRPFNFSTHVLPVPLNRRQPPPSCQIGDRPQRHRVCHRQAHQCRDSSISEISDHFCNSRNVNLHLEDAVPRFGRREGERFKTSG